MSIYNEITKKEVSPEGNTSPESTVKTPGQELKEIIIIINDKEDLLDKIKDDVILAKQNAEGLPDDQVAGKLKALNAIRDDIFNEVTNLQLKQAELQRILDELDKKFTIKNNSSEEIDYVPTEIPQVPPAKDTDKVTLNPEDSLPWNNAGVTNGDASKDNGQTGGWGRQMPVK